MSKKFSILIWFYVARDGGPGSCDDSITKVTMEKRRPGCLGPRPIPQSTPVNTCWYFFFKPDTDECLAQNGGCEHTCTDSDGSHTCSCDRGYRLNHDQRTCKGTPRIPSRQQRMYIAALGDKLISVCTSPLNSRIVSP